MEQLVVGDHRLDIQVRGVGEPLLAIHGAILADAFECISPALCERFQLISYHRRGFATSSPVDPSTTMSAQAADAVALLDHLGVDVP